MRPRIVLPMLLCLAALCSAVDRKQFADAIAAVDANLKTPAGKQYEAKFGQEFSDKYMSSMRECKKSVGELANFDMFIRLKADGKDPHPSGNSVPRLHPQRRAQRQVQFSAS